MCVVLLVWGRHVDDTDYSYIVNDIVLELYIMWATGQQKYSVVRVVLWLYFHEMAKGFELDK